jgi:hypothetical protein
MKKGEANDYRSRIDRHTIVGTLAHPDGTVISHTSPNTLSSYGSSCTVGGDPVVGRKMNWVERNSGAGVASQLQTVLSLVRGHFSELFERGFQIFDDFLSLKAF